MLEVRGLSAAYDGIRALRDIDISVAPGEMVAIIGPNGAGKSTMLNCLSGVVKPSSGEISFDGSTLSKIPAHRIARAGLLQVPEGRQILGSLTVWENLSVGGLARGNRRPTHQMDDIVNLFPRLGERFWQAAGTLSGGEQQMLAIGRALMGAPKMLLLDEPSLGLAPVIIDQVFAALKALNESGLTVLLVEQNARRALQITERAYVIEQGRIVHAGKSEALLNDAQVAEHYFGKM